MHASSIMRKDKKKHVMIVAIFLGIIAQSGMPTPSHGGAMVNNPQLGRRHILSIAMPVLISKPESASALIAPPLAVFDALATQVAQGAARADKWAIAVEVLAAVYRFCRMSPEDSQSESIRVFGRCNSLARSLRWAVGDMQAWAKSSIFELHCFLDRERHWLYSMNKEDLNMNVHLIEKSGRLERPIQYVRKDLSDLQNELAKLQFLDELKLWEVMQLHEVKTSDRKLVSAPTLPVILRYAQKNLEQSIANQEAQYGKEEAQYRKITTRIADESSVAASETRAFEVLDEMLSDSRHDIQEINQALYSPNKPEVVHLIKTAIDTLKRFQRECDTFEDEIRIYDLRREDV